MLPMRELKAIAADFETRVQNHPPPPLTAKQRRKVYKLLKPLLKPMGYQPLAQFEAAYEAAEVAGQNEVST